MHPLTRESMIEVRMSRELAHWLGAIRPLSLDHHRELRSRGDIMLVRESTTLNAMFWPLIPATVPPA